SVFGATYQPLARVAELGGGAGAFVAGELLSEPFVVVRGEDDTLRAFFNVCRHHATCVAHGRGRVEQLVCPYHGWTYHLDGSLKKAPRMAGISRVDRDALGLVPLESQLFEPFVFGRIHAGEQPPPARALAAVMTELRLDGLEFV